METRTADRLLIRIRRKLAHAVSAHAEAITDKARARHAHRIRRYREAERQLTRDVARSLSLLEA